jgi:hypothetical protein
MTAKPATVRVDSIVALQAAAQNKMATALSKQIEQSRGEKSRAISAAQNNRELQRLKNEGNGWAAQKLNGLAKSAGSKYESRIAAMNGDYTTLLAQNAENIKIVATATAKQNDVEKEVYDQKTASMANFFLYFAIIATVIMCFAGLMMGIYRATHNYGNHQPMTDSNRDAGDHGDHQQDKNAQNTGDHGNHGDYQVNETKVEFNGKLYEPSAIKRWAQTCDNRAAKAKTDEQKQKFTELGARLWSVWNAYEFTIKNTAA